MRCLRYLPLPLSLLSLLLVPALASAEPWIEDKAFFTENANAGSSMVDAADLDGDGWIDIVFANGNGYDKGVPNSDAPQQAFKNEGGTATTDISAQVFGGGASFNGRAVKIRDIDRDGDNDILLGVTWQTQSQLFLNSDGQGNFVSATDNLPQGNASIGDLELGDVDGDGDLDIILADWGPDAPVGDPSIDGGTTLLWIQSDEPPSFSDPSSGVFEDATLGNMPLDKVRWSWDLEFVDVDNDWDLDIAISCFACTKQSVLLFANDGDGKYTNVTPDNVAQGAAGAFDVEPFDLNGDNFLDLLTLRDGTGGRNRILVNNKMGGFTDSTDLLWPKLENPASFDHMAAFLDYNSDGRADFVLGAFDAGKAFPDRLLERQGNTFKQNNFAFNAATPGTYALVLADFNQDRILDVVQAQNENGTSKKVFLGSVDLLPDTAPPVIANHESLPDPLEFGVDYTLRARIHDNKSPLMLHDFQAKDDVNMKPDGRPYIEFWNTDPGPDPDSNPGDRSDPGQWYGEYLWRLSFTVPSDYEFFCWRTCAIDAAGNGGCNPTVECRENLAEDTTTTTTDATDTDPTTTGLTTETTMGEAESISSTITDPTTVSSDPVPTTMYDPTTGNSEVDTNTTIDSADQLDDDGCGCDVDQSPTQGVLASLALLGLLGLPRVGRRRRS